MLKKFGAGGEIDETTFKTTPPGMLILDSVSALCGKDKEAALAVCKRYKQYAVKYSAPVFLIAHMTKEGDMAGLLSMQHEVDSLVTLFPHESEDSDNPKHGVRELEALKNRYGATHRTYHLIMTERGLVPVPPEPERKGRKRGVLALPTGDPVFDTFRSASEVSKTSEGLGAPEASKISKKKEKINVDGQELVLVRPKVPKKAPLPPPPPEPPTAAERAKAAKSKKADKVKKLRMKEARG